MPKGVEAWKGLSGLWNGPYQGCGASCEGGQGNEAQPRGRVLCVVMCRVLCSGKPHLNFTKTELSSREDGWGALDWR